MASKGSASVSVTVDDLASAVLRKINTSIRDVSKSSADLAKNASKVDTKGLSGLANESGRLSGALTRLIQRGEAEAAF